MKNARHTIATDICGVLCPKRTFFRDDFLTVAPRLQVIRRIKRLVKRFDARLILISREPDPELRERRLAWLKRNVLWRFGISEEDVFFCTERHEKRDIAREQDVTCFIDDRGSILNHLRELGGIMKMILYRPTPKERALLINDPRVTIVQSARELFRVLRGFFQATPAPMTSTT